MARKNTPKVYKRVESKDNILIDKAISLVRDAYGPCLTNYICDEWNIFCVNQKRGKCIPSIKTITIPFWTFCQGDPAYWIYYLAHELAHAITFIDNANDIHGPIFMSNFKRLCPVELQHYEYGYKPRNAARAGVARKEMK